MSDLARLRSSLHARIQIIEVLLERMTAPVQNLTQSFEYNDTINRINELTLEANTNLLDIEAEPRNNIETPELTDFRTSLSNIKCMEAKIFETMRAKNAEKITSIHNKNHKNHPRQ